MNPFDEHKLLNRIDTLETTICTLRNDIVVTNSKITMLIDIIDKLQYSISHISLKQDYA